MIRDKLSERFPSKYRFWDVGAFVCAVMCILIHTVESERRNHLATIACSALILRCLEENLYPSWDAQNMNSVRLAEKLGYEFDHEYIAYEVDRTRRVH